VFARFEIVADRVRDGVRADLGLNAKVGVLGRARALAGYTLGAVEREHGLFVGRVIVIGLPDPALVVPALADEPARDPRAAADLRSPVAEMQAAFECSPVWLGARR
jgi:hypothetical protein